MKAYSISVMRPQVKGRDQWETRRNAMVVGDSFDSATKRAIDYFNDIEGTDDHFVVDVSVYASTEEGEGGILLM